MKKIIQLTFVSFLSVIASTLWSWPSQSATIPLAVSQVEIGDYHVCALLSDSSVWCWGSNSYGQLGDGTFTMSEVPKKVNGLPAIEQIRLFGETSCALDKDGFIWCWGESGDGEFLQGAVETCFDSDSNGIDECFTFAKYLRQKTPIKLPNVSAVVDFDIGPYTICAINEDSELLCWGDPHTVGVNPEEIWVGEGPVYGDNWDSDFSSYYEPYVTSLEDVRQVSVGGRSGSCALLYNGEVWCFPIKSFGQGDIEADFWTPTKIEGVSNAISLSAENYFASCAKVSNGDFYCWDGYENVFGVPLSKTVATRIPALTGLESIHSSGGISCGRKIGIGTYCWGLNYGNLISGDSNYYVAPTLLASSSEYMSVGLGWSGGNICAVTSNGSLNCWGSDAYGQLGDGPALLAEAGQLEIVDSDIYNVFFEENAPSECGIDPTDIVYCDVSSTRSIQPKWRSIKFPTPRKVSFGKPLNNFTTVPVPLVTGDVVVGGLVKVSVGSWKPKPKKFTYQWMSNGIPIAGKTQATLKLEQAFSGSRISVQVKAESTGYNSVVISSAQTETVLLAFSRTSVPKITGTAKVGATLVANLGSWNPVPASLNLQWFSNGVPIIGQNSNSLSITNDLLGKKVSLQVTAYKDGYRTIVLTSKSTASVKR